MFAATSVLAFLRLGSAAWHARVWAEDGAIFLQQSADESPVAAFTTNYAGYLHSTPRTVAEFVTLLPVRYWAVGVHVGDALVVGAMATVVFAALAHLVPSWWARGLAAAYVALVPVGPEVTDSIANLQWYVLPSAVIALLWTPRSRFGRIIVAIVAFAATTTSPLAGIVLLVALLRLVLRRDRSALATAGVTIVGFVIQTAAMIFGTPRNPAPGHRGSVALLTHGYLSRVVADSVRGIGSTLPTGDPHGGVPTGVVLIALVVLAVALVVVRHGRLAWTPVVLFGVLSVLAYLPAAITMRSRFDNTVFAARYYVIPAILLVVGLVIAVGARRSLERSPSRTRLGLLLDRMIGTVGAVVLVYALVTSYQVGDVRDRNKGATWGAAVRAGHRYCDADSARTSFTIAVQPGYGLKVVLACSRLRAS